MDRGSILVVHFVKLIDEANSLVGQHESSGFEDPFTRNGVSMNSCCETNCTSALTGGIDDSGEDLLDVFQELGFGSSWITEEKTVDVTSDLMLSTNILWDTSEHGEGQSLLDEQMSVNAGSHGLENLQGDAWFLGEFIDLLLVFVGELNDLFIAESLDVVGLDDGVEDWEAVLDVGSVVEFVDEDTGDFNFVSWSCSIDEIVEDINLLLARNSTWWDSSRSLLDRPFLVVTEEASAFFEVIWASTLAKNALAEILLAFIVGVVHEWTFDVLATIASEVQLFQLWEDSSSLGDDTSELDESVQMHLSQIPEFVFNWEVLDSDENLPVQFVVVGIKLTYQGSSDIVEAHEHESRFFREPDGKSWVLVTQMVEHDFETLLVVLAHFVDFLFIDEGFLLVLEVS